MSPTAGSAVEMAMAVARAMTADRAATAELQRGARQSYESRFTEEANHSMLLRCYRRALGQPERPDGRTATECGPAA